MKNAPDKASGDAPSDELRAAFESLLATDLPFAEFRDLLANALYLDVRQSTALQDWLSAERQSGRLPKHLYRMLESDIRRICSEDVPTLVDTTHFPRREPTLHGVGEPSAASAAEATVTDTTSDAGREAIRAAHDLKLGDMLCERYEIIERAPGGNMARVYKALDAKTGLFVAVKLLRPENGSSGRALRALQDEYAKGNQCIHPNIVEFHALERHAAVFFIVMEWLDGEHLADRVNRVPGVAQPFEFSFDIVEKLAAALNAIHRQGFVHADVKPGNVMLLPDGDIKLFDFGVSQAYGEHAKRRLEFDAGVLGAATPAYSSAAVLAGESPDPTDDLYSLACVAYRMLAGNRPYGDLSAALASEQNVRPERIESLSPAAWTVLDNALQHNAAERPVSIDAFVEGLRPVRPVPAPPSTRGRSTWLWLAAAAAVVTVAVLVLLTRPVADAPRVPQIVNSGADGQRSVGRTLEASSVDDDFTELPRIDDAALPGASAAVDAQATVADSETSATATDAAPAIVDAVDESAPDAPPETVLALTEETAADTAATGSVVQPSVELPSEFSADEAETIDESVASAATALLPLDGSTAAQLSMRETDAVATLVFDTRALTIDTVGVYLNSLTRDGNKETLSLLDAGLMSVPPDELSVRLQPRPSWTAAPDRDYRLLIMDPAAGRMLAAVPVRIVDQSAPQSATPSQVVPEQPDAAVTDTQTSAPIDDELPVSPVPSATIGPDRTATEATGTSGAEDLTAPVTTPSGTATAPTPTPGAGFGAARLRVSEADRMIAIELIHRGLDGELIELTLQPGDAIADEDFIAPSAADLRIVASGETSLLLIPLVNDSEPELNESFRLEMDSIWRDPLLATGLTITIVDDD